MPHQCSVCALPADVRDYGEQLIAVKGGQYREVVALAPGGPSKSAWHRHMHTCYRRRKFYGIGQRHSDVEERIIVERPDGSFWLGCERFNGKFRENDVLLTISYVTTPLHEIGNPKALISPAMIDEAEQEHRQRFPEAKIAAAI